MSIDFRLTDEMNSKTAALVIDHLRQPRLWIPSDEDYGQAHREWLERTEAGLVNGTRHALLARFGKVAAGVVIFRPEPEVQQVIGIRNISINPTFEGRHVGAFILRNAE